MISSRSKRQSANFGGNVSIAIGCCCVRDWTLNLYFTGIYLRESLFISFGILTEILKEMQNKDVTCAHGKPSRKL